MTEKYWQKLSLAEQLGNIGSEISRARYWDELNDSVSRRKSLERALELVDYTLSDKRHRRSLKEILYLREIIGDFIIKAHIYNISLAMVEKFCLGFAMMARK